MKILFATGNESKSKRFSKGLKKYGIDVISLKDLDIDLDIEENGKDAIENAIIKAKAYYNETKMITMAMDDSLYLDNVPEDEQPGLFVRRVNGKKLDDEEMIEHYSNLVKKYGKNGKITARWIYGLAVIKNDQVKTYTWSKEDFYLTDKRSKKLDVGYPLNSISINISLNKYFTEMTDEDKESIKQDETDVVNFIRDCVSDKSYVKDLELTKDNIIKYFNKFEGFIKHNDIYLDSLDDDRAVLYANISKNSINPGGIVHGGLLFGLGDTAMGALCYLTGRTAVTIDSNINYLKPCKGKKVKCVATPIKVGNTIGVYKADIYNENDELSVVITGTFMFLNK
jgi:uncharacterized protein (TIGR00369 family)